MLKFSFVLLTFLVPQTAVADGFEDGLATTIYYSKWVFLMVGCGLILRATIKSSRGESTSRTTHFTLIIAILPSLILWLVDAFWQSKTASSSFWGSGGRPMLEYYLAQAGLLSANELAQWKPFGLLIITIFMASAASVSIKASAAASEEQMGQGWKDWLIPSVLIFVIFNPSMTTSSPSTSGAVMKKIMGTQNPVPTTDISGVNGGNGDPLNAFTQIDFQILAGAKNSIPQAPLVLSLVNAAMDDFVGSVVGLFSSKAFQRFGMSNMKSVTGRLAQHIQDPDLRQRVEYFARYCFVPAISEAIRVDKNVAGVWAGIAVDENLLYPFANEYLPSYKRSSACQAMVTGKYYFDGLYDGQTRQQGKLYKNSLEADLIGALGYQDPNLRRKFGWKDSAAAAAESFLLKKQTYKDPDAYFGGSVPLHIALVAQTFGEIAKSVDFGNSTIQAQQFANDSGVVAFLSKAASGGYQLIGAAKGAVESELVNLKIPVWMGVAQAVLLACFPLVFALSLMPGKGNMIGYFLLTLFWAKSYVIAWALISNFDSWLGNLRGLTPNQMLAITESMQTAQLWSPALMAVIIFGAGAAAQSLSKGGGAA